MLRAQVQPTICAVYPDEDDLVVWAHIPSGYQHVVLEAGEDLNQGIRQAAVAGLVGGLSGMGSFRIPNPPSRLFLRIRAAASSVAPSAEFSGSSHFEFAAGVSHFGEGEPGGIGEADAPAPMFCELDPPEQAVHVLNRLGYGPALRDLELIDAIGVSRYVDHQLRPSSLDAMENFERLEKEAALFFEHRPYEDDAIVAADVEYRYFKGVEEPPAGWFLERFDHSEWLIGNGPFGYDYDDLGTELEDMERITGNDGELVQPGYYSVYLRHDFFVEDPNAIDELILLADYDDGFAAYLNGSEIASANLSGRPPRYNQNAESAHEAEGAEIFLVNKAALQPGINALAIQVHNVSLTSSDLLMKAELVNRRYLDLPLQRRINGIEDLQRLAHLRGIYSVKQLQAVLGEFWENHFTTDYDKVAEYFYDDVENSDGSRAMGESQAELEAAQAEYREYQFFYENALGYFGDLLLYSATSVPQLIYLDNVINLKDEPNENYAREILELFAFGVDNRYTQTDIEELARCFTGWTIRKVWENDLPGFPESALNPPTSDSVESEKDWKFFRGTREPSPGRNGEAATAWTQPGFDDGEWENGVVGVGYGDGDDATVLDDMRYNYVSVYIRRNFEIADPDTVGSLTLFVNYDDAFVAYLNGVEIGRANVSGSPPAYDDTALGNHEEDASVYTLDLSNRLDLLRKGANVLALQGHNRELDSSDLSLHPRFDPPLFENRLLPGSIENGDPNGVWTFRFSPEDHDLGEKILFEGTPYEMVIPAGRRYINGLRDAADVIEAMTRHPSTSEFICIKLINRFVSDEISLESYHGGSAPPELMELTNQAIAAWNSTTPRGHIETVLRSILSPVGKQGVFWSESAHRSKIKTAIEYINSSARALDADVNGGGLEDYNEDLGMTLFTRDDPDGWSELGPDWMNTSSLLERVIFAQDLAENRDGGMNFDALAFLERNQLSTARDVIEFFNGRFLAGSMPPEAQAILERYANTSPSGNPDPLDPEANNYEARMREFLSLILSAPHWQFQ